MNVQLAPVTVDEKEILRNLLEKYLYESSQWEAADVNALGLYGYDWLDCYWTEPNRWAFFLRVDGKLVGFAMVNDYQEIPGENTDYAMAEFFVMHKYRRCGVGREAAFWLFDHFPGQWQLMHHAKNAAGGRFGRMPFPAIRRGGTAGFAPIPRPSIPTARWAPSFSSTLPAI